jgi:MoaA/NifB/PqqE/SkfB family radical SAM enzyme
MESKKSFQLMPRENVNYLLDLLKKESVQQANLLGGEPTLHPEVLEIGRQISELGIPVGLSTNGLWREDFREKFKSLNYPLEVEITYLGKNHPNYDQEKINLLEKTFKQLRGVSTSLGWIITNPEDSFEDHLAIAKNYGFKIRWAFLEPTQKSGQTRGYSSLEMTRRMGNLAVKMIKKANKLNIRTWADLTVPRCAINSKDISIFECNQNDIQFKCPPFFDISPNLDVWRCLPLAGLDTPNLRYFNSLIKAYTYVNGLKDRYSCKGTFKECASCNDLGSVCSGGPAIAKKLNGIN